MKIDNDPIQYHCDICGKTKSNLIRVYEKDVKKGEISQILMVCEKCVEKFKEN